MTRRYVCLFCAAWGNEKGLGVIPTALAFMVIADPRRLERFAFAQVTDETGSDSE